MYLRHPHRDRKDLTGLTIHVQSIMSNFLLAVQRRVEHLAVQRRPVVFPFYWDADSAGHAEGFSIVLLGYNTWREAQRTNRTGEVSSVFYSPSSWDIAPL